MFMDMMMNMQEALEKSEYTEPKIQVFQVSDIKIADINDFSVIEEIKKHYLSDRQIEFIERSSSRRTMNPYKSWFWLNLYIRGLQND